MTTNLEVCNVSKTPLASNTPLACFIHSTTLDLWKDTYLIELLDAMKNSGLLAKMSSVCVINTGKPVDHSHLESHYAPVKVVYYSENTMDFENATIRILHTFAKLNPTYKILYMHTKGISYTPNHVFYLGVQAWNQYMRYCLVTHHARCVRLLDVYDTVGCNFRPTEHGNGQHYSGNYWWGHARYIQQLPIHYLKDKYHPEFWLLQKEPLYFNVHSIEHMYEQAYPLANYVECVERNFEENVLFCKVGYPYTGLCNQLYNIANTMVIASVQNGRKVVILDRFINDIHTLATVSSSSVLDLGATNAALESYGIVLIDKADVQMTLDKVEYGLKDVKVLDITERVRKMYWHPNHLYIPQWTDLNGIMGEDPCPQLRKQIYVYYSLNGIPFLKMFHERKLIFNGPVEIGFTLSHFEGKPPKYVLCPQNPWLTRINRDDSRELTAQFDVFLKRLCFQPRFRDEMDMFWKTMPPVSKVHVLHLRNEQDAISHWASLNGISETEFQEKYESAFIDAVCSQIASDESHICLALTSKVQDNVIIDRLREKGYTICARPNSPHLGRELNGIVDMILGIEKCNGVFIGNINPHTNQGSTFSYVLYNALRDKGVNCLTLNIDDINEPIATLSTSS